MHIYISLCIRRDEYFSFCLMLKLYVIARYTSIFNFYVINYSTIVILLLFYKNLLVCLLIGLERTF